MLEKNANFVSQPPTHHNLPKKKYLNILPGPFCNFLAQVTPDSPSGRCGLQAGDLVLAVEGRDISNRSQADASGEIVAAGDAFAITVRRYVDLLLL